MLVKITAPNSHKLQVAFTHAPKLLTSSLNGAMQGALVEIAKRTPDGGNGGLFRFKNPRERRTGMLAQKFRLNIATGAQALKLNKRSLRTEVRSTVKYADFVASKNDFYGRILGASRRDINEKFNNAINETLHNLHK